MSDDLISRQAAIAVFYGAKFDEGYCTEYEDGYNDGIDFAISSLSVLPSAQPEIIRGSIAKELEEMNKTLKDLKRSVESKEE